MTLLPYDVLEQLKARIGEFVLYFIEVEYSAIWMSES